MTKIYFAGPDVFRQDAVSFFQDVRAHAARHDLECLIPIDAEIEEAMSASETVAAKIFQSNCDMIRTADLVLANMAPFRGVEPDSGTLFEIGMAYALEKPVILYDVDANLTLLDRVCQAGQFAYFDHGHPVDVHGVMIENFGLPFNLMPNHAAQTIVAGTVFDALDEAARIFARRPAAKVS